jgi:hypothetical protein
MAANRPPQSNTQKTSASKCTGIPTHVQRTTRYDGRGLGGRPPGMRSRSWLSSPPHTQPPHCRHCKRLHVASSGLSVGTQVHTRQKQMSNKRAGASQVHGHALRDLAATQQKAEGDKGTQGAHMDAQCRQQGTQLKSCPAQMQAVGSGGAAPHTTSGDACSFRAAARTRPSSMSPICPDT